MKGRVRVLKRQETGWGDTGAASAAEDRRGRNGCGWEGGLQLGCRGLGLHAEECEFQSCSSA